MLVHNTYREPGGEDTVWRSEARVLERYGCQVRSVLFDNHDIGDQRSPVRTAGLAVSTLWSRHGSRRVRDEAKAFGPDVVHFHNTFPLVSPAAYYSVKAMGLPVVQTLHNYRLMCPNVFFFRDGHPCEDCLGRRFAWPGVMHACYRDSRSQTAVTASMVAIHRMFRTWSRKVDVFIALSEFSKNKFITGGLPRNRIVVKPNFVEPDPRPGAGTGKGFVFAGRLVAYKGITTLLHAWQPSVSDGLHIAGDGPLASNVEMAAKRDSSIQFHGRLSHERLTALIQDASALIVPSLLYENFPMTIVEAFACGVPVVASRLGAMAEIVSDGRTGLLFSPGDSDDLATKLIWARDNPQQMREMGVEARREFEAKYTAERNFEQLMQIYSRSGV